MRRTHGAAILGTVVSAGLLAAIALPAAAQSPAPDWASTLSGPVVLSGWQASPAEGNALTQTLLGFQAKYPNIKVDYQPVAGDYPTVMAAKIASGDVPDLFYVNADYAQQWISDGYLYPLDDYITKTGFDTSQFFPAYADIFKQGGKTYGFPKDGNTIAMAYNSDIVKTVPTTMDELQKAAEAEARHRATGALRRA